MGATAEGGSELGEWDWHTYTINTTCKIKADGDTLCSTGSSTRRSSGLNGRGAKGRGYIHTQLTHGAVHQQLTTLESNYAAIKINYTKK